MGFKSGLSSSVAVDSSGTNPPSATPALEVLRESPPNLADPRWGLKLDGVTDDGPAFNAIAGIKTLWLPDGKNLFFSTPLAVPSGTVLLMGAKAQLTCGVTTAVNGITLDHGAAIKSWNLSYDTTNDGPLVFAAAACVTAALIANKHTDGTQESAYVEGISINGNTTGGATSGDGILLDSLFVNTSVRHVDTFHCSGYGLHTKASGVGVGLGAAFFEDVNAFGNSLDQILVEQAFQALTFEDVNVQALAAGHHGLHLNGTAGGSSNRVNIRNLYCENGVANAAALLINNVDGALVDGVYMGQARQSGQAVVRITGTTYMVELRNLYSITLQAGDVIVDDQTNARQVLALFNPAMCNHYDTEAGKVAAAQVGGSLPAVPATNTAFTNPFGWDQTVYITAAAGGSTTVQSAAGSTIVAIPASTTLAVDWPTGVPYKLIYGAGNAPTWQWVAR